MARRRAPRGSGSVGYDRERGTWYARVYVRAPDGRRVAHKSRAATPEAAEEERRRLVAQYGGDPTDDEPTSTLGEYLDSWLPVHSRSVRATSAKSYRTHVTKHIKPLLGGIPLHRLRARDVDRLVTVSLAAGLHPATVHRIVATLRIALARAVRRRLILDNPASHAELPSVEPRLVQPLTSDRVERILEAAEGTWLAPVLGLIAGTGIRVGEAVGLDWGDAHEDEGYVVVRRTKTIPRAVPISDDAAEALRRHRAARTLVADDAPVFVSPHPRRSPKDPTRRMTGMAVAQGMRRLLLRHKLPPCTPHGLRHGVATQLVAQGVHMRVIAEQLGHRDPAMTARVYAHVIPQHQRDAARLLNRRRKRA